MKVDEQEFRSFIANVERLVTISIPDKSIVNERDFNIVLGKVCSLGNKFKQMLETPKPSKWRQLKLIG